jgi:MFS family permease
MNYLETCNEFANIHSGNDIGPFRAIEESMIAHLTPAANRGDIYAWYSLIGTAGAAVGMMTGGWSINYMRENLGWDTLTGYRTVFWAYAIIGLLKFGLAVALSKACEAEKKSKPSRDPETAPLLSDGAENQAPKKPNILSYLPDISPDSRTILVKICVLFALDAFASGLASLFAFST